MTGTGQSAGVVAPSQALVQYCTFVVCGATYGVAVQEVQEVIRYQPMTPVPLAPEVVRGLINLRGRIVTAIDLRGRLGFEEREPGRLPMNVVVRSESGPVSLLVDEIGDVVELDAATVEPPPPTLRGVGGRLVTGVHQMADRLVLLLDVGRAIDVDGS